MFHEKLKMSFIMKPPKLNFISSKTQSELKVS